MKISKQNKILMVKYYTIIGETCTIYKRSWNNRSLHLGENKPSRYPQCQSSLKRWIEKVHEKGSGYVWEKSISLTEEHPKLINQKRNIWSKLTVLCFLILLIPCQKAHQRESKKKRTRRKRKKGKGNPHHLMLFLMVKKGEKEKQEN